MKYSFPGSRKAKGKVPFLHGPVYEVRVQWVLGKEEDIDPGEMTKTTSPLDKDLSFIGNSMGSWEQIQKKEL